MAHHHLLLGHKKYPKSKNSLDKVIYVAAFAAPIFELPQLSTIYSQHSAKDVSAVTWGCFALTSGMWLLYAIRHKIKPLIISYLLFFIIEALTFAGILIYRHHI